MPSRTRMNLFIPIIPVNRNVESRLIFIINDFINFNNQISTTVEMFILINISKYRSKFVGSALEEAVNQILGKMKYDFPEIYDHIDDTCKNETKLFKTDETDQNETNLMEHLLSLGNLHIGTNIFVYPAQPFKWHPPVINDIPWSCLNEEKWRLLTYLRYPHSANKSAILLAQAGFVYIGAGTANDDKVICCFCCAQKRNWRTSDDISEVHRDMSPICPMVTAVYCSNVPMIAQESGMAANASSYLCNQSCPELTIPPANASSSTSSNVPMIAQESGMAANASSYLCNQSCPELTIPSANAGSSTSRNVPMIAQENGMAANASSYLCNQSCPELTIPSANASSSTSSNVPIISQESGMVANTSSSSSNQSYSTLTVSLANASSGTSSSISMAVSTNYSTIPPKGHEDSSHITAVEVPTADRLSKKLEQNGKPRVKQIPADSRVVRSTSADVPSAVSLSQKLEQDGKSAVKNQIPAGFLSADKLFEKLKQDIKPRSKETKLIPPDSQAVRSTSDMSKDEVVMNEQKEQNSQLRQQTVCKICMDKEVTVVFLPCGHFVSCTECAAALKDCPVCRNLIKGTVDAFQK